MLSGGASLTPICFRAMVSSSLTVPIAALLCRKNRADKYIIGAVRPQFETEREDDDMTIYRTINDVPSYYKVAVQKAMNRDALKGTSDKEINVSEDLCRTLTVLDRLGKLD